MRVLLVQPPHNKKAVGLNSFSIPEPLALETVAAGVKHHNVRLFDMRLEDNLGDELKTFLPDVVATTSLTSEVYRAKAILKRAKEMDKKILTVIGGHHATMIPIDFNEPYIDFIVIGEGDITFAELLDSQENNSSINEVAGIAYRKKGELVFTEARAMVSELDSLPFPDRKLTSRYRNQYYRLQYKPVASLITSRGCSYRCSFCSVWKHEHGKYRIRGNRSVLEEIKTIKENFISIRDDDFFQNKKRSEELCSIIEKSGIKKTYKVIARTDSIVKCEHIIKKWREVGLEGVSLGLESFRDEELKLFNKKNSINMNEKAVRILKDNGISIMAHFVVNQDYTGDDFKALGDYIGKLDLSFPIITVLTPLPNTDLYEEKKDEILTYDYEKYDLAHSIIPTKIPAKEYHKHYADLIRRCYMKNNSYLTKEFIDKMCLYLENAHE